MMLTDILIIAVFALFVYKGYKNGFINSVYSILSLAITIILVSLFKDSFIKAVAESDVGIAIGEFVAGKSSDPKVIAICSEGIIYLISVAILYALIRLILRFTLTIINSIASLPVIDSLNRILGLALGAVIGVIWLVIIVGALSNIPKTAGWFKDSAIIEYFKIIFM